jgi:hypothetical protein
MAFGGHAVPSGIYNGSVLAFALEQRRAGRRPPERLPPGDLVLLARTVATAFAIAAGSDLLQETWVAVDKRA